MTTRRSGGANSMNRPARRSLSATIAAPMPRPGGADRRTRSRTRSRRGGSPITNRHPATRPSGASTTATSRSLSTDGAVQKRRSRSSVKFANSSRLRDSSFASTEAGAASWSRADRNGSRAAGSWPQFAPIHRPSQPGQAPGVGDRTGRVVRAGDHQLGFEGTLGVHREDALVAGVLPGEQVARQVEKGQSLGSRVAPTRYFSS